MTDQTLAQLRRIRWAVRATLALGLAASVAANMLHADPNPISRTIAAWPPLALLLTIELISRVPVHHPLLSAARILSTAAIAGIAAWVSYWHMAAVAGRYGEHGASGYLLPFSVDGLVAVASICLVELAGRIRAAEQAERTARAESFSPAAAQGPIAPVPAQRLNGDRPAAADSARPGGGVESLSERLTDDELRDVLREWVNEHIVREGRTPGEHKLRAFVLDKTGVGVSTKRCGAAARQVAKELGQGPRDSQLAAVAT